MSTSERMTRRKLDLTRNRQGGTWRGKCDRVVLRTNTLRNCRLFTWAHNSWLVARGEERMKRARGTMRPNVMRRSCECGGTQGASGGRRSPINVAWGYPVAVVAVAHRVAVCSKLSLSLMNSLPSLARGPVSLLPSLLGHSLTGRQSRV